MCSDGLRAATRNELTAKAISFAVTRNECAAKALSFAVARNECAAKAKSEACAAKTKRREEGSPTDATA